MLWGLSIDSCYSTIYGLSKFNDIENNVYNRRNTNCHRLIKAVPYLSKTEDSQTGGKEVIYRKNAIQINRMLKTCTYSSQTSTLAFTEDFHCAGFQTAGITHSGELSHGGGLSRRQGFHGGRAFTAAGLSRRRGFHGGGAFTRRRAHGPAPSFHSGLKLRTETTD